jgi:hypothetical protein
MATPPEERNASFPMTLDLRLPVTPEAGQEAAWSAEPRLAS